MSEEHSNAGRCPRPSSGRTDLALPDLLNRRIDVEVSWTPTVLRTDVPQEDLEIPFHGGNVKATSYNSS